MKKVEFSQINITLFKRFFILMILFPLLGLTSCETQHTHSYDFSKSNSTKHWKECSCGEWIDEEEHNFGDWKTTIDATEESTGTQERKCNTCDYVEDKTIAKLTHTHEYGQWEVSLEPTKDKIGTLSRVCSKNSTHIENHQLPALNKINYTFSIANATCLKAGKETYTYSIDKQEFTFTVSLNALGHKYSDEWDSDEENHWHNAICEHSSEKGNIEEHIYEDYVCKTCKYEYYSIGLEFDLNSDGISYSVSGIGIATDLEIVIPRMYHNLPVTEIKAEAFANCTNMTNVIIGKNVKTIGRNAFLNCNSLTDVTIPNNVDIIGYGAFNGCSKIESIKLPFVGGNRNAKTVSEATIFGYIFGSESFLDSTLVEQRYDYSNKKTISYCLPNSLKSVEIFEGSILDGAFWSCNNLKRIILYDQVTLIGHHIFYGCSKMEELRIPSGFNSDDFEILSDYRTQSKAYASLWKLSAPLAAMEDIGHLVEEAEITGGERITTSIFCPYVAHGEWSNFFLRKVTIPKSIISISRRAFEKCPNLKEVYYEGTIEDWCDIDFQGGSHSNPMMWADHFYIRNSNNEWEEVTSIEIPDGRDRTGYATFYGFNNVESLIIPESIRWISTDSFKNCDRLRYIYY
ncbi:MAG: leucine-rich repeat domain-containing protein, partial [Anaeroplasmataceae bacterium]|nr:leucine-rich repeat domain-containing protein [Anaeroplasmataceae bacterium]